MINGSRISRLVPSFFILTAVTAIALTLLTAPTTALVLRLIALAALGVWIYIRVVETVKINAASLDWNPDQPPVKWRGANR